MLKGKFYGTEVGTVPPNSCDRWMKTSQSRPSKWIMDFFSFFKKKGIEVTGQSSLSCPLFPSIFFSIPSKISFLYAPINNIGIEVQGGHVEGSEIVVKLCHSLFSSLIHSLNNCFFLCFCWQCWF